MSTPLHDTQQLLSDMFDQDQLDPAFITASEERDNSKYQSEFGNYNQINISALSLENCDAQHLVHCYQLALNFGVPTARRAIALYQSVNRDHTMDPVADSMD